MTAPAEPRAGLSLGHKLLLAALGLSLLLLWALLGYVGPSTQQGFLSRSGQLLDHSVVAMRELARSRAQENAQLLVDLVEHTTQARQRALADLPFQLYADPEQLKEEIRREDGRRSERIRANIATLAKEQRRRADREIDVALAELRREQQAFAEAFAQDLRTAHGWLGAMLFSLSALAMGLGLRRLVVLPVRELDRAAARIGRGELDLQLSRRSGDEIGALALSFSRMASELRQSRAELDALNASLEAKVEQKTRALAHAEKMASIGTLAGGLAHEFHNLIGGIRGCAKELAADEQDQERRETLGVMLRATDRATAIVQQLRRMARQDGKPAAPVRLWRTVDDALRLAEPEARRRGVEVVREQTADPAVLGDEDALHQVFVNLITNALQAMAQGGTLRVALAATKDHALLRVTDTGVGIEAGLLSRIFEPFYTSRADAADPAQRGTGLGLSVSYGIVDAHGGSIEVRSQPGDGAEFCVRLPLLPG